MATTKNVKRTASGRITYRGETFAGYNKPKRTPKGPKKSAVLAKKGVNHSELVIIVTQQKISLPLDIGHVRHGNESGASSKNVRKT